MSSIFKGLRLSAFNAVVLCCTSLVPQAALADGFTARIVGGINSDISSVPSTVALLNKDILDRTGNAFLAQFCGGTLINQIWVVTAAHCFVDMSLGTVKSANEVLVLDGTSNLLSPVRSAIEVTNLVVHPDFSSVGGGADIALLQLRVAAESPAAPIDNRAVVPDSLGLVAGWGALDSPVQGQAQDFPNQLQSAQVFMVAGEACNASYPRHELEGGASVNSTQVCAAVPGGGRDSCQGDSGGPLYRIADNGELSLTGVTSYGLGCALPELPGVYTRVQSYRDWINLIIDTTPAAPVTPSTGPDNQGNEPNSDDPADEALPVGSTGGFLLLLLGLAALRRNRLTTLRQ